MRVLITGVTGFAGRHLAAMLVEHQREAEVWGLVRWNSPRDELTPLDAVLHFVTGDLTDAGSLVRALQTSKPDILLHLAAASTVSTSWATPTEVMNVNVLGTVNLFEAVRTLDLDPVIVLAGSAEAYGAPAPDELPVRESQRFRPVSPYGVSKATVDLLGYQYHAAYALRVVRLRLFNHTGAGRPDRFVASSFARQIAEIERGRRAPVLEVGNLDVVRDFTDVRDVARGYWAAAVHGEPGAAYNVCSARPVSIRELLDRLRTLSTCDVEVRVDPGRLRTAEIPALYGDPTAFATATGWSPTIPLEQTLHEILEWWRRRV